MASIMSTASRPGTRLTNIANENDIVEISKARTLQMYYLQQHKKLFM